MIESYATELSYFFKGKNFKFNYKMLQKEFWNIFLLLSVIIISDGRSAPVYQHKFNLRNENGFAKLLCGKLVHISISFGALKFGLLNGLIGEVLKRKI